jgi:chorismate mutase
MLAIRGATTIEYDSKENIIGEVSSLLSKLVNENKINKDEIVSIIFSNTADIKSFYPATAARVSGYDFCPLFSVQEPEIIGSLPLCIRILIFLDRKKSL